MDKKTIIWKLGLSLLIAATAIVLLGGLLKGELLYQLPAPPLP